MVRKSRFQELLCPLDTVSNHVFSITGTDSSKPTLVAIKGTVFDVSRNSAYAPGGSSHGKRFTRLDEKSHVVVHLANQNRLSSAVFAGKDPSRALAKSSLKAEECVPEWDDLEDQHKTVLGEWFTFFSKRYNVVGKVRDVDTKEKL
jgi:cytochrome b involved in lipid metabolism